MVISEVVEILSNDISSAIRACRFRVALAGWVAAVVVIIISQAICVAGWLVVIISQAVWLAGWLVVIIISQAVWLAGWLVVIIISQAICVVGWLVVIISSGLAMCRDMLGLFC